MMNTNSRDILDNVELENNNYFIISWNSKELTCSNSFEDLTGFTKKELAEFPYKHYSLSSVSQGDSIQDSIINFFVNNTTQQKSIDYSITTKNGRLIWFRESISFSKKEDVEHYISLLFDITDIKNKELDLNEKINEKIELNRSKDKLISIISHDLRAPFSSLLGFTEILLNEPNLPEKERVEYLEYIYDASKIQLQMVNHLLDWTRLQSGNMKIIKQRLNIKDIVDSCVSVLTGSAVRKDIEIKVNGKNKYFVNADERLISQAITNLLSNAVKFTPSGKKIKLDIIKFKDNMIEVIVKDEGIGIDEKNQQKLFKIESKFSKPGTAGEKGSGLGLALVKEIIEKNGGNIWFYSELNQGSEFHFTLPKAEDTILIVEEDEEIRNAYSESFSIVLPNYKMKFCSNGFEALNSVLEKAPAAILTYHNMPLMNGLQLVSSLRKKDTHNNVPVVVLVDEVSSSIKSSYNKFSVRNFVNVNSTPEQLGNLLVSIIGM